ncbi:methyltransferase domain-containing protein [Candidatus Peregrinibacteria bacterium]|jgi:ubiquinone/menaquinone biosynthesis C-methylase UbiE|nr:methyltransferase domain-containing protein [Candidatus Peregrinibacteria bacterium]MBT3598471.1 methyltransferase domain-containing protein [Candidatus Peregrinibacteria bacterium]MBT4367132.1 methyltransferase domain-containing protein [Candidatus Peregrinibacteria bacterium]MBT4586001.1 methyltransferase domain-containing protein [Candidatus Peregrinibacteria bacterium]MBT6730860.1 methyltransferase domain-containing protein [Candidatus Peregrinibacteria bacterium]
MEENNSKPQTPHGVLDISYKDERINRKAFSYRLRRRADEVILMINKHFKSDPRDLLDLGPAEGKSLSIVQDAFPNMKCTGLEYSQELLEACEDKRLTMIQGDAMHPPFPDNSFDIVTATAVIEHVESPLEMIKEVNRILRPGGIFIITTPDPLFEKVAVAIGHLQDEDHQETMTLRTLKSYLSEADMEPVFLSKFMCWPWGFKGELVIERIIKAIGLRFILLNQIAVGLKSVNSKGKEQ